MACRFLDGFDHYATPQLSQKWTSQGQVPANNYTISNGAGRESGGSALSVWSNNGYVLTTPNFSSESTWTAGMAVNLAGLTCTPFTILDAVSGYAQLIVGINSTGYAYATVQAGTYTATTLPVAVGTWFYLEGQVVISATAGTVTLRINGTVVVSQTGINTAKSGALTANTLVIGASALGKPSWSTVGLIDDLYLFDGTGTANTTFPASIPTVQALYPTGDGALAQWTPSPYSENFANVDDDVPDGAATTNQTSTVGAVDAFTHTPLRPATGTVFAVQHVISARTAVSTSHSLAAVEVSGGTTYADTGQVLGTAYSMVLSPHDTDPATGAAFTVAGVNALEFGYELTA